MANLRAGVIGLGVMGKHHARILANLPGVELVGVVDPLKPSGVEVSAPVYTSVEKLLAQGLDYCFVAVPTELHHETGLVLASAGVHALIEKPLASNALEARSLARTFALNGLIGAVGHVERYNAALQQASCRVQNGDLGDIFQIATRRQGPGPGRIADVGVIKDLATHDVDLTTWITRSPYRNVYAKTTHRSGRAHEDLVMAVCELENGCIASHTANWLSPFKERRIIISGERGAFIVDTLSSDLRFIANGVEIVDVPGRDLFQGVREGDVIRFAFPRPEPLRLEHESFRDAVLGLNAPIVTMDEGVAVLVVADAISASSTSGRSVTLDNHH